MCAIELIRFVIENIELSGHFDGFGVIFGAILRIFEDFEKNLNFVSLYSLGIFLEFIQLFFEKSCLLLWREPRNPQAVQNNML